MAPINDGGPAFPPQQVEDNIDIAVVRGASMRDLFALGAMRGLQSAYYVKHDIESTVYERVIAADAYELADAMLAEREKDHERPD